MAILEEEYHSSLGPAMEQFRLRVRIGAHDFEFEAEGERETVERKFGEFRELIENVAPTLPLPAALPPGKNASEDQSNSLGAVPQAQSDAADAAQFRPIFRDDRDLLSLSATPEGGEERVGQSVL